MNFEELQKTLREFASVRDWEQFHSPKNLSSALVVEAAELLEIFQWMKEDESRAPDGATKEEIEREIADIQIYLARLADVLHVDIARAVENKLTENARKYPVDKAHGNARKHDAL